MTMDTTLGPALEAAATETKVRPGVWRDLATGALGSAAFGAAAMAGHGVRAMGAGAWMGPALFAGGALLAMPPQYLFTALAGGRTTPADVLTGSSRVLAAVGVALLGLAAPAAFFSATLRTFTGAALLVLTVVSLGVVGIASLAWARLRVEDGFAARCGAVAWFVFALALGGRLMIALGHHAGWL